MVLAAEKKFANLGMPLVINKQAIVTSLFETYRVFSSGDWLAPKCQWQIDIDRRSPLPFLLWVQLGIQRYRRKSIDGGTVNPDA